MSEMKILFDFCVDLAEVTDQTGKVDVLAIGDMREWHRIKGDFDVSSQIAFADFPDLSSAMLSVLQPELIVSPLLTSTFDCIDLSTWLASVNYKGQYRALSFALPRPEIVIREIKTLCPDLDFDVVEMEPPKPDLLN